MKLTKRELQAALDALAKANSRAHIERAKIAKHCAEVYGVDPADIDNEEFIDRVDGGCGVSEGMSADEFDRSMLEHMAMAGIEVPNVEVQGQVEAQLRTVPLERPVGRKEK